jgi:hypothetical protein
MFKHVESRIRGKQTGAFDFDVESLNTLELVLRHRLVFLLRKIAIEENLKITFTDYAGVHYHLEWAPSEVPSMEFRWPHSS